MDLPETATIVESPKIARVKYSAGPKDKANFAKGKPTTINARTPRIPPMNEKTTFIPSARPAIPFLVSAKPSKVDAIEAGVPGVFIRIAEIPPEKIAEFHTPMSIASPWFGDNQKVKGVSIATAIVAVSPGRVPITSPEKVPKSR